MQKKNPLEKLELLGRLTSAAEELEDISNIKKPGAPRSKQLIAHPHFSDIKPLLWRPASLINDLARHILLKNLGLHRHLLEIYASGKRLGLSLKAKSEREIREYLAQAGLEVLELKGFEGEKVSAVIRKGLSAKEMGASKRTICYFEAGLLSGLMETALRKTIFLKECQCAAIRGHSHCRFIEQGSMVIEGDQPSSIGRVPLLSLDQYSEENIRLLTSLASHALTAIENALIYEKTKRQSIVDNLTGVYNHRYFQQSLRIEIKRTERQPRPLSLIMIDLDNFKRINDHYGHPRGDRVLKIAARIFVHSVRDIDVVARYGGDEFAIILPQTNLDGAQIVARRILKSFEGSELLHHEGRNIPVRVSMGLGEKRTKGMEAEPFIESIDNALMKAKRKGGNQFVLAK